jgi:FtsH-binding integral membrane protein
MASPPKYTDSAPKSYGATPSAPATEPLLAAQSSSSRNAWLDSPDDDLPDDFKVGVAVIDCDAEIRLAFIRKVYSILFVQLLATSAVSLALSHPAAVAFHQEHPWTLWIPMVGSFAALGGVYWKRHQHPANLILLGLFTIFEAMMIGTITSYYDSRIVSFQFSPAHL